MATRMLLIIKLFSKRDSHQPMSPSEYARFFTAWWVYTVIWVALVLLVSFFPGPSITVRWILGGALAVITPTGGGHFTTAQQITTANIGRLAVAWEHRSGDVRADGANMLNAEARSNDMPKSGFMGTPIVVDDTLYYCTPFNRVFALDPATGKERWSFDPKVDMSLEPLTNCRGVSYWRSAELSAEPKVCDSRIIFGTLDGRIFAIDSATGERCADFGTNGEIDLNVGLTEHHQAEYSITSAPAILGNSLVTGAMVADSRRREVPSGVVRAYDVQSGAFKWGWNPVPPGASPTDEQGRYVAGTTNVWSTISVDAERNLVIVPTGN